LNKNYQTITSFLENFTLETVPAAVIMEAKRTLLDTIGCMVAGTDTPLGQGLKNLAGKFMNDNGAWVMGMNEKVQPFMAAVCNGYMANAHDADDGHRPSRLHAGGIIIPAALVAAQEQGSTGKEFLEAVIIGFELGYRAGMVTTGWGAYHGSAMGSTFGAAAAVARLMGMSPHGIINAMGIAEMQAPNCMLMGWIESRVTPMVKEGMGWSAGSGFMSALMAESGITGTLAIFNGAEKLSEIEKLGSFWELERHYFKPHPGCRWTHVPTQTLQKLMAKNNIRPTDIDTVTVRTLSKASHLDNCAPSTMEDAQYSIPYIVAATLVDGECGPLQMQADKLVDPAILDMASRVIIECEPEFDRFYPNLLKNEVQVSLKTGESYRAESGKIKGDYNFPMTDAEIKEKFTWMTANRLSLGQAAIISNNVWSMDADTDMLEFMTSLHSMCENKK